MKLADDIFDPMEEEEESETEIFTPEPEAVIKPLVSNLESAKKFPLKDIEKTFSIPGFQRRKVNPHIRRIKDAILEEKFYDNIITVIDSKKKPFDVIDGQQRLEALKLARDENNLKSYDLIIRKISEDAREVYRRMNSGKPLTTADFLKSMDDGSVAFFNAFKQWCGHYSMRNKVQFSVLAYAMTYSKLNEYVIQRNAVLEVIKKISEDDIRKAKNFFNILEDHNKINTRLFIYKVPIFWNLFKIFMKEKPSDMPKFLNTILKDKVLKENSKFGKSRDLMDTVYKRMMEDLDVSKANG